MTWIEVTDKKGNKRLMNMGNVLQISSWPDPDHARIMFVGEDEYYIDCEQSYDEVCNRLIAADRQLQLIDGIMKL